MECKTALGTNDEHRAYQKNYQEYIKSTSNLYWKCLGPNTYSEACLRFETIFGGRGFMDNELEKIMEDCFLYMATAARLLYAKKRERFRNTYNGRTIG